MNTTIETTNEKCPHCNARLTGRWERLSPGLCKSLVKFYDAALRRQSAEIHLQDDLTLTKTEYTNFYKLRYFGLLEHSDASGCYRITALGERFVRGEIAVCSRAYVFRNEVKATADEFTTIEKAMKSDPYWLQRQHFAPPRIYTQSDQARLF